MRKLEVGNVVIVTGGGAIFRCVVESATKSEAKLNTGMVVDRVYGDSRELTIKNSNPKLNQQAYAMGKTAKKLLALDELNVNTLKLRGLLSKENKESLSLVSIEAINGYIKNINEILSA